MTPPGKPASVCRRDRRERGGQRRRWQRSGEEAPRPAKNDGQRDIPGFAWTNTLKDPSFAEWFVLDFQGMDPRSPLSSPAQLEPRKQRSDSRSRLGLYAVKKNHTFFQDHWRFMVCHPVFCMGSTFLAPLPLSPSSFSSLGDKAAFPWTWENFYFLSVPFINERSLATHAIVTTIIGCANSGG